MRWCAMTLAAMVLSLSASQTSQAATAASAPASVPLWEQAKKAHDQAMSQFHSASYAQAQSLFKSFIDKFPSNESVPQAYWLMAKCQREQGDGNGFLGTLDEMIKKMPGSPVWFVAYGNKLSQLKTMKKNEEYLDTLEAMWKALGGKQVRLDLTRTYVEEYGIGEGRWCTWFPWYRSDRQRRWSSYVRWNVTPFAEPGWERDLVSMCDTPDRARRALLILDATLDKYGDEKDPQLGPDMEFAQYLLLLRAGQDAEAARLLAARQEAWGDDVRGLHLLLYQGEWAQELHDDKTADAVYGLILKKYGSYGSLADCLRPRFEYLQATGQAKTHVALGRYYLKEFPQNRYCKNIIQQWVDMAKPIAIGGNQEVYQDTLDLLKGQFGDDSYPVLRWQIEVKVEQRKFAEALPLMQALAQDKYWTQVTFNQLSAWAGRDPSLQAVVEDMRTRYKVPANDPSSSANGLLKDLQEHIKADEVRFIEEIGESMAAKYPADASTIEAMRLIVNYYFQKVLDVPRDKWVNRMIQAYPRHPGTFWAMQTEAQAYSAAKKYRELAALLDQMNTRFPGMAEQWSWYPLRLQCFDAAKDLAGRAAFVKKYYQADLKAGAMTAVDEMVNSQISDPNDSKKNGDLWMEQASALAGTRGELYCLGRAWETYYWTPARQGELHRPVCWHEGLETIRAMQDQKLDPEMKWLMEFGAVHLLSDMHNAGAALDELDNRLTAKKYRDITDRLNMMHIVMWGIKDSNDAARGLAIGLKLQKLCYTEKDETDLAYYLGGVCDSLHQHSQGMIYCAKPFQDCLWPALLWDQLHKTLDMCDDVSQYCLVADQYIAKLPQAQEMAAQLLLMEAQFAWHKTQMLPSAIKLKIINNYPASDARGQLEPLLTDEQKKVAAPAKKGKK